jgi:hypothetical protein
MGAEKLCPLYRRTESLNIGKGLGYCDLDSSSTTCEGDFEFCERPEGLKIFLRKRIKELQAQEKSK